MNHLFKYFKYGEIKGYLYMVKLNPKLLVKRINKNHIYNFLLITIINICKQLNIINRNISFAFTVYISNLQKPIMKQ